MADFETQIKELERLAGNAKAQQELGSRLVKAVAGEVMAERRGQEIERPDTEIAIRKGDLVPPEFQDRIKVDEAGRALHEATVQSLSLVIWLRVWLKIWLRIGWNFALERTPLNQFRDFAERISFSPDELKQIDRLRQIRG